MKTVVEVDFISANKMNANKLTSCWELCSLFFILLHHSLRTSKFSTNTWDFASCSHFNPLRIFKLEKYFHFSLIFNSHHIFNFWKNLESWSWSRLSYNERRSWWWWCNWSSQLFLISFHWSMEKTRK